MNLTKSIIISALLVILISFPAFAQDVNSELIEAAENGQTERVKSLLAAGADANAEEEHGNTAFNVLATDDVRTAVVQIFSQTVYPDYIYPWQIRTIRETAGSGVIIENNQILTAAHVIDNTQSIYVRKTGSAIKYEAELQFISDSSDLALITVTDREFFKGTKPVKLGDLPKLGDEVTTWGFPEGGTQLALTKGIVSRIDFDEYAYSATYNLVCQIDAAINSGASGGGAFVNNQLVGITFQGMGSEDAENIGYIIPPPVIKQFLKDTGDGIMDGVPALGIKFQAMGNPQLREKYQMQEDMTGQLVTINSMNSEDDTNSIKTNDVILEVNGVSVANDGTIPFVSGDRIQFLTLIKQMQIGEIVPIRLLRNGEEILIKYQIEYNSQQIVLVTPHYSGFVPDYEIIGGLVFQELSRDYIDTSFEDDKEPAWMTDAKNDGQGHGVNRNERIVFLSTIMPDEINKDYEVFEDMPVVSVNGMQVDSMDTFRQALEENEMDLHTIEFDDHFGTIVFDKRLIEERDAIIRNNYGIDE